MAKGYWIARVDVKNEEAYKPYAAANPAIFKKYGGRFLVRGGIVGKLDDHVARTGMAFRHVEFAAPYQIAPAELFEYRLVGCSVRFEAVLIVHIDAPNPITLGHSSSPFVFLVRGDQ